MFFLGSRQRHISSRTKRHKALVQQPTLTALVWTKPLRRLLLFDKVHRVIIEDGLALEKILDIANDVAMEHYFISPSSYINQNATSASKPRSGQERPAVYDMGRRRYGTI